MASPISPTICAVTRWRSRELYDLARFEHDGTYADPSASTRLGAWTTKLLQGLQVRIHSLQDLAQSLLVYLTERGAVATEVGDITT
jgi:hypothetical protein